VLQQQSGDMADAEDETVERSSAPEVELGESVDYELPVEHAELTVKYVDESTGELTDTTEVAETIETVALRRVETVEAFEEVYEFLAAEVYEEEELVYAADSGDDAIELRLESDHHEEAGWAACASEQNRKNDL